MTFKSFIAGALALISSGSFAQSSIIDASRSGDLDAIQQMYEMDADTLNYQNAQGYTPLILAAYYDRVEVAKFLLENGAVIPNQPNTATSLQAAAYKGFVDIVDLLLEYGANPDIQDPNGMTALHYAAQFNHVEIARLLLEAGANREITDEAGRTARQYAQLLNQAEVLNLFEE